MLVGLNNSGLAKRRINDKEFSKVAKIRVKKKCKKNRMPCMELRGK